MGYDIMSDKNVGNLWILNTDGSNHQKLTIKDSNEYSPRWSPNGDRIAFVSQGKDGSEIFMYWTQTAKMARLTQLVESPSSITWSRDGLQIAFSMFVPEPPPVIATIPKSPKGAKWAKKPRITDRLKHESDGSGYIPTGFSHLFIMPSSGGLVQQVTSGNFHHRGAISWSNDNESIYFSANRTLTGNMISEILKFIKFT
jgi:Tol biopolymer transport system component